VDYPYIKNCIPKDTIPEMDNSKAIQTTILLIIEKQKHISTIPVLERQL